MTTALDTPAARDRRDRFYRLVRATGRFWLWFFFKSVDVRHPERVPDAGPVLLCINHPNNFIDSLLVGAAVRRKVHYLATAGLFRHPLVARKSFRGRVLVSFGPPVPVTPYRDAHRQDPVKAVEALTTAIQWAMEAEVVHVARIDATQLVRAVEELYRDELARELAEVGGVPRGRIDPIRLSRSIVDAVNHFRARDPERVERLWQRIEGYRALLAECHVKDEAVRARLEPQRRARRIRLGWQAVVGLPLFAYGASVNLLPYWIPRWTARRMARKETDYATWRFLASVVAYPTFWGIEVWLVARVFGAAWALAFALSLPLSGAVAYRYWVGAGRLTGRLRFNVLALTREHAARRLTAERQAILTELEHAKAEYLADTKGSPF